MYRSTRTYLSAVVITMLLFVWEVAAQSQNDATGSASCTKTVRDIKIVVLDVFDKPRNSLYTTANDLKVNTREKVVKRELLLHRGACFNQFLLDESERILRRLKYLRNVKISSLEEGDQVDLLVVVQDTWTFLPVLGYSANAGSHQASAGISEANVLGHGKRAEALYILENGRQTIEGVYDDNRLFGSDYRLLNAWFDRDDGQRFIGVFGRPFRSLLDTSSWTINTDSADTIGRLFEFGEERYIYRQQKNDLGFDYTIARGVPEKDLRRYSFGWDFHEAIFTQAQERDYRSLDLDPDRVASDPSALPFNRRFNGPSFTYQRLEPDYVSLNYIDRFSRIEDYNLGADFSANLQFAPELLGSTDDALLYWTNRSSGWRFGRSRFARLEAGLAGRLEKSSFQDNLFRIESKYFNVLGPRYLSDLFIGRHTIAASLGLEYGSDLDGDRELLIGAENGLRAYKSRAFSGNKRASLNIEDRVHLVDDVFDLLSVGGAVFIDAGGASSSNIADFTRDELYADVGFGFRFAFPRSSGERVLRLDIAIPLRNGPDGTGQFEPRIVFAGGQLFNARMRSESVGPEKAAVEIGFDR